MCEVDIPVPMLQTTLKSESPIMPVDRVMYRHASPIKGLSGGNTDTSQCDTWHSSDPNNKQFYNLLTVCVVILDAYSHGVIGIQFWNSNVSIWANHGPMAAHLSPIFTVDWQDIAVFSFWCDQHHSNSHQMVITYIT